MISLIYSTKFENCTLWFLVLPPAWCMLGLHQVSSKNEGVNFKWFIPKIDIQQNNYLQWHL